MCSILALCGTRKGRDGRGVTCYGLQGLLTEVLDHSVL